MAKNRGHFLNLPNYLQASTKINKITAEVLEPPYFTRHPEVFYWEPIRIRFRFLLGACRDAEEFEIDLIKMADAYGASGRY